MKTITFKPLWGWMTRSRKGLALHGATFKHPALAIARLRRARGLTVRPVPHALYPEGTDRHGGALPCRDCKRSHAF